MGKGGGGVIAIIAILFIGLLIIPSTDCHGLD